MNSVVSVRLENDACSAHIFSEFDAEIVMVCQWLEGSQMA